MISSIVPVISSCGVLSSSLPSQVDTAWLNGDHEGARRLSTSARTWNIVGIVVGVILYVLIVVAVVAANVAANSYNY